MAARDSHFLAQVVFLPCRPGGAFQCLHGGSAEDAVAERGLQLIQELALHDHAGETVVSGPADTGNQTARAMDVVVGRELTRANRLGTEVTFSLNGGRVRRPSSEAPPAEQKDGPPRFLRGAGKALANDLPAVWTS